MASERTDIMKSAEIKFKQMFIQLVEELDLSPIEITLLLHRASSSWDKAVAEIAIDHLIDKLTDDVKKVEARNGVSSQ